MTLHIIGNGFDLHHGIESSYSYFCDYAWSHTNGRDYLLGILETCFPQECPNGTLLLWSDLERALGNPDIEAVQKEATEDIEYEDEHEIRFQPAMEDAAGDLVTDMFTAFHDLFEEWVNAIDISFVEADKDLPYFDITGMFLSFNYTETLETVYEIDSNRINHIHGRRNCGDELIVGHCNDVNAYDQLPEEPMVYEYAAFEDVARKVNEQRKDVSHIIDRNHDYWDSLSEIDKVVVYGHSLADVDIPYFKEVIKNIYPDSEWYFSIYFNNDETRMKEEQRVKQFINSVGIDSERCRTFCM